MKINIQKNERCRICNSSSLKNFLTFDDMPFTDQIITPAKVGTEFSYPIDLFFCEECKVTQTLHDVEVQEYYRDYKYTSSSSEFTRSFMKMLSDNTFNKFELREGDHVIEIGSGDGEQLKYFKQKKMKVLGIEPSAELTNLSKERDVPTIQTLFNAETIDQIPKEFLPAQVVLLTYTFDHLPQPKQFLESVKRILDPNKGVLIIEIHDLSKIIARCETCLFEHEHSIYMTPLTIKETLERFGFKLLSTDLVPEKLRRGNSLLVAAALNNSSHKSDESVSFCADFTYLKQYKIYEEFAQKVAKSYSKMRSYVQSKISDGFKFAGYGGGGRGVMTLAMSGLTHKEINFLCDKNASFHGFLTPNTHVPIVSPEYLLQNFVDEVIVFSFGYLDEIKRELKDYLQKGGKLVSMLELLA
ncbi:MAG: methyltransferase domain-containing protein [Deltaproteobacteria bacterium]|nr:methyltransferase domain-containing protein [Deltaproteobacteria bacterium]